MRISFALVLFFLLRTSAEAALIPLSQYNVVSGQAGGRTGPPDYQFFHNSYYTAGNLPVADGATAYWIDPNSIDWANSSAGDFATYAAQGGEHENGSIADGRCTMNFEVDSPDLVLAYSGLTMAHSFENWCDYTLTDMTTNTVLDSHRWATEDFELQFYSVVNYTLDPAHTFELSLHSYADSGDLAGSMSTLTCAVVPEPATGLALGALLGCLRRR